jgi:putative hydrolase of HD superfamily
VTAPADDLPPEAAARIAAQLAFLSEADRLKSVVRASPLHDGSRRETTAEHSWHVALYALVMAEHAIRPVAVDRVIRMLLVHDLVEIDAGDVPIHAQGGAAHGSAAVAAAEARAADRLFALLPPDQARSLRALWDEFEAGQTDDARFAKALDRVPPVVANLEAGGGTWRSYDVTRDQLDTRVGRPMRRGAPALWAALRGRIDAWFDRAAGGG